MLSGYESCGCSAAVDPCTGWQVLDKSLQHRSAHQPLSFGLEPTCSGPMPTITDAPVWSLLISSHRAKRGACSAQSITNPLLGPSTKEEKEGGGNRGGNGMNQLRIDPNTNTKILYFI